jgi:DNA-binding response OmpR family regulator
VPDLVVLDLNMPEEDGLSIIRDLKSRINVPVIMLTATAARSTASSASNSAPTTTSQSPANYAS